MKISYTESGEAAMSRFKDQQAKELERFIASRKFVFGDEVVEITANDVREAEHQHRLSNTALKRSTRVRLMARTYLMGGMVMLVVGMFWDRIRMMIYDDPIALTLSVLGAMMSVAGAYLSTLWKLREDQEESADDSGPKNPKG
jgi:hypothetical protein